MSQLTSLEPSPSFPTFDHTNGGLGHSELACDQSERTSASDNFASIGFGQFPTPDATLSDFVGDIVGVSSEKQMCRIDARWIVAAMKNVQPVRNRAVCDSPRKAMRQAFYSVGSDSTIPSASHFMTRPEPAAARAVLGNLVPEPLFGGKIPSSHEAPPSALWSGFRGGAIPVPMPAF